MHKTRPDTTSEDVAPSHEGREEEEGLETGIIDGTAPTSMEEAHEDEEEGEDGEEEGIEEDEEEESGDEEHSLDFANIDPEDLDKMLFATDLPPDVDPALLKKIMTIELARLKAMRPSEFVKKIDELKHLHSQIYAAAEGFIKDIIAQVPHITPVLKQVGEYDQLACDKVLAISDNDWRTANINDGREFLFIFTNNCYHVKMFWLQ